MTRIAPVPRDECKDLATVFEITEAVMGFVPNSMLIMARDPISSPPLPAPLYQTLVPSGSRLSSLPSRAPRRLHLRWEPDAVTPLVRI
jgi:hypothetical protein